MAGDVLKIQLDYRDGKQVKVIDLPIRFVSMAHLEEYDRIDNCQKEAMQLQREFEVNELLTMPDLPEKEKKILSEKRAKIVKEFKVLYASLKKEVKIENDDLKKRQDDIYARLLGLQEKNVFEQKINLVIDILERNNIDERYLNIEFWKNNIDYGDINKVLDAMVSKDMTKKKVTTK